MRFRKNSIAFTWLISYLIILLIPLIANVLIFNRTQTLLSEEINRANSGVLQDIRRSMDTLLVDVKALTSEIILHPRLSSLLIQGREPSAIDNHELYSLRKDFAVYHNSKTTISSFYVYLKNADLVVSPTLIEKSRVFFDLTQKDIFETYDLWKQMADSNVSGEYFPLTKKLPDGTDSYLLSYYYSLPGSDDRCILVIELDHMLLQENLHSVPSVQDGTLYILDRYNRTLYSDHNQKLDFMLSYDDFTEDHGRFTQQSNGESYIISYARSTQSNWVYLYSLPRKVFLQKISYLYQYTGFSMLACILLGTLAILLLIRKNYMPVNRLMQNFSAAGGKIEVENEYHYLENILSSAMTEKNQIKRQLNQQQDVMRKNYVSALIKGTADTHSMPPDEFFRSCGISFQSNLFAAVLFYIEDEGLLFTEDKNLSDLKRHELLQYAIANISEEIFSRFGTALTAEVEGISACLVSLEDKEAVYDKLKTGACQIQEVLREYFGVGITISMGGLHTTYLGIHLSYNEAMEALQYMAVVGAQEIICYQDIPRQRSTGYTYPMNKEQQLINCIQTGNAAGAKEILSEIIHGFYGEGSISPTLQKCLTCDLVCTLMKSLSELGDLFDTNYLEKKIDVDLLLSCNSYADIHKQLNSVLERICADCENAAVSKTSSLSQNIKDYIAENYQDPNLTIGVVAEAFHLTGSYITKLYREQTGETVIDYINRFRMNTALDLIKAPENRLLSIEQISLMVGYDSIRTFNRHFKKVFGTTPSKLRENL